MSQRYNRYHRYTQDKSLAHLLFRHKATVCLLQCHFLKDITHFNKKKGSLYSRNMAQATKKGKEIKNRNEQFIGDLVKNLEWQHRGTIIGSTILTLTDALCDRYWKVHHLLELYRLKHYNRQFFLFLIIKIGQGRITLFLLSAYILYAYYGRYISAKFYLCLCTKLTRTSIKSWKIHANDDSNILIFFA